MAKRIGRGAAVVGMLLILATAQAFWGVPAMASDMQLRAVKPGDRRLTLAGPIVTVEGDTVARATTVLKRVEPTSLHANAEFMSVGPAGPWELKRDTTSGLGWVQESFFRLRVTIGSGEGSKWLWIDEIKTGGADSRRVTASYSIHWGDPVVRELQGVLLNVPRTYGTSAYESPIRWYSPTTFAWIFGSDSLVVEQRADSLFDLTLRPRIR